MTNWNDVVRNRPEKYVGSTDDSGLHVLACIVINNSIDEILAGHASNIEITIHNQNTITVLDDGRGIPVEPYPGEPYDGIPMLQIGMTSLHASGLADKQRKSIRDYDGIGIAVVNALSEWMRVEVYRAGKIHVQEYSRGLATFPLKIAGVTSRSGTQITFRPDSGIFTDTAFSFENLSESLRMFTKSNAEPNIILRDYRTNKQIRFS